MRQMKTALLIGLGMACLAAQKQQVVHPHAKILGALIYSDLSVSFDGAKAPKCLYGLRTDLGILMQVYWETDQTEGCNRDAEIFLTLKDQPAVVVLERIIEQISDDEEATWQMRDGVLEVGLKSRFSKRSSHRVVTYPIDDLLFAIRSFGNAPEMGTGGGGTGGSGGSGGSGGRGGSGNSGGGIGFGTPSEDPDRMTKQEQIDRIIELITKFIEPDQWEQNGGECTITSFKETLLISAPNFIHRQIGGYPFDPVRPREIRKRRVNYFKGKTSVR